MTSFDLIGSVIKCSSTLRDLGVILDPSLTMRPQVSKLCQSVFFQLRQFRRIRKSLSRRTSEQLIHAIVTSRLDYCNSIYYGLPTNVIIRLQAVLNAAARLVTGGRRFDHVTPILKSLHWLPYPQRIQFKVCLTTYKCLHGLSPAYLTSYCQPVSSIPGRASLRSSFHGESIEPRKITKTFGPRSFSFDGPRE